MFKRILSCTLIFIMIFSFSSCDMPYPKEFKDKILIIPSENKYGNDIEYSGKRYINKSSMFTVTNDWHNKKIYDGDTLLARRGVLGYTYSYFSETDDNPLYIYEPRSGNIYLSEDYDYKSDTFVLDGTNIFFVFSECLSESNYNYDLEDTSYCSDLTFISKTNSRLRMGLGVFYKNGEWFAGGKRNEVLFSVSDKLIDLLNQANVAIYKS